MPSLWFFKKGSGGYRTSLGETGRWNLYGNQRDKNRTGNPQRIRWSCDFGFLDRPPEFRFGEKSLARLLPKSKSRREKVKRGKESRGLRRLPKRFGAGGFDCTGRVLPDGGGFYACGPSPLLPDQPDLPRSSQRFCPILWSLLLDGGEGLTQHGRNRWGL